MNELPARKQRRQALLRRITRMVRKLAALALVFSAGSMIALAQTSTWKIDPAHSGADFSIRHMGLSNVHGHFGNVNGSVLLDEKDFTKSSVSATVDVTTVDTGVTARDNHLKSPDFFDVGKFPAMTFVSKKITASGDDYHLIGDLTLHGVTKTVDLMMDKPGKEQIGMDGKSIHRGFSASTTIHRQDFGLTWNGTLKSGDNMLGDDVKVTLDVEMVKQ
jgi:polyisoprenoid-binding protein YceI